MKSQETCVYGAGSWPFTGSSVKDGYSFSIELIGEPTVTLLDHNTILVKRELETRCELFGVYEGSFHHGIIIRNCINSHISVLKVRLADLSTNMQITTEKSSSTIRMTRFSGYDDSEGSPGLSWYGFQAPGKQFPILGAVHRVMVECTNKGCLEWKKTNKKEICHSYSDTETTGGPVENVTTGEQGLISSGTLFTVCSQKNAERIKKSPDRRHQTFRGEGRVVLESGRYAAECLCIS